MSTFKPLGNHVLIQIIPPEEQGRVHLIEGSPIEQDRRSQYARNVVIAVGPGAVLDNGERMPIDVEPGNVVMMRAEVCSLVDKDRGLVLCPAQHILAIEDDDDEYQAGVLVDIGEAAAYFTAPGAEA